MEPGPDLKPAGTRTARKHSTIPQKITLEHGAQWLTVVAVRKRASIVSATSASSLETSNSLSNTA